MLGFEPKNQKKPPRMKIGKLSFEAQEEPSLLDIGLTEWLAQLARKALMQAIEIEVEKLCGSAYSRDGERPYYRAGSTTGSVNLGRRETLVRPRVRMWTECGGSKEVPLETWQKAKDVNEFRDAIMRGVLCGVSTRDMAELAPGDLRGKSSSQVSRIWQEKAAELVRTMQESDLSHLDLLALMVDGIVLSGGLVATVAMGIDVVGDKHILGFRVGASESTEVCTDLLANLSARGLKAREGRALLAVLDGSKALSKAVLKMYPQALIQRCLVHKERNIRAYLPRKHWGMLARLFDALRKSQGAEAGKAAAKAIEEFLSDKNAQARESFREAGDELLCVFNLDVPNTLNTAFLSTNAIENAFRNLRRHIGRVCRWRAETDQADRWLASGLMLAQKGFKRIRSHEDFPHLVAALERKGREWASC